jgi:glutathione S-transferase
MKLYSDIGGTAPSPRRVRIFIAEKGLDVSLELLDLHKDNRTEAFREKNPLRNLPVLELDDGTCISETMAICRYFDELHPQPPLFGSEPLERAIIEMWNRRAEMSFYLAVEFAGGFLGEDTAERARRGAYKMIDLFDRELATREFIAGSAFSVADITTKVAIDFGIAYNDFELPADAPNFARWHANMSGRPSASA